MSVRSWWPWAAVVLVLLASAAVRLRLLDVPLDRDEGEYAYIGSLLLDGIPPYARAYNMKMPGIYGLYAVTLAVFGRTGLGVHLGLLAVTTVSTVLVFLLGRRLFDARVGVAAAVAFATLSLNPHLLGFAAYAEHFVLPAALLGALLLVRASEEDRPALLALAGVLFGVAFLVKQSGGAFAAFGLVWVLQQRLLGPIRDVRRALRDAGWLVAGAVAPFALVCGALVAMGTFPNFWFWTFRYALEYASAETLSAGWRNVQRSAGAFLPASWPIAALAMIALALALAGRDADLRRRRAFLALLAASSAAGVSAGLYFRPQYFLLLVPALALLAGAAPFALARALAPARPWVGPALAATLILLGPLNEAIVERGMLFRASAAQFGRELYGRNPFPESVEVARYIRERSAKDDRIAVIGSEPQIYFYAERPAATGYIYMYPLMEQQPYAVAMQHHMVKELEALRPRFLVFVNVRTSWLAKPTSDLTLARWFQAQWKDFDQVGFADIVSSDVTRYQWDDAARDYRPESSLWLAVFRRRE
ncbi:MAG: glycosyltransferase family 39 protein [Candidatus Rokubacteria bacterium]|nr:glycosyltransferase family 39 protein [Candidatus Rokubacteria bacterium]